jgi:hypothetical protein
MKTNNNKMRHCLTILISLILISCSPVKKYRENPEVLSWDSDIRKFEQLDKSEKYSPDAVLFAGSSSIKLWSSIESDMAPYPVIQRGYGGARLSDFAVYADRIISPHKCRAIVLFVANDITGSKSDKSPEEVASLFSYILKTIRRSHPETPVFWIEITPTAARWDAWDKIQEGNRRIREICEQNKNTWFITTQSAFLDRNGKPKTELFIGDKLHLNPDGYQIWSGIIKKELEKVIPINR